MRHAACLTAIIGLAACSAKAASGDQMPIAAIEVPTSNQVDHSDLIALLRRLAPEQGFHVDDDSAQWSDFGGRANDLPSPARKTLYAGVWRGKDDDDLIAVADDGGHNGRSWITCYSGDDPLAAKRFWKNLNTAIFQRWPKARAIPILPSGALPLVEDLKLTSTGYKIVRSAVAKYQLPSSSPLIADDH